MRRIATIIALAMSAVVYAQQSPVSSWFVTGDQSSFAGVNAGGGFASKDFQNRFITQLWQAGFLDSASIQSQSDQLHPLQNRMGADYELALQFRWTLPNPSFGLLLKAADVAHVDASIPRSAFDLVMRGNQPFAGDTLDMSSAQVHSLRYQQYGLGLVYQPGLNTELYALVSYINGEQFVRADIHRAWLYTSALGDTLSASVKGDYWQSDTANVGFARSNGGGAALDAGVHMRLDAQQSQWHIDVNVYNLGMIQWAPQTVRFQADSNMEFRGLAIGDIRQVGDQFDDGALEDSLMGDGLNGLGKGVSNQWMPGWFHADVMQHKTKGVEWGGGIVFRWNANYTPFGYLRGGYRFGSHIATHAQLGYGGYAGIQFGLEAAFEWEQFTAGIRWSNLEGLIAPANVSGAGAQLTLRYILMRT